MFSKVITYLTKFSVTEYIPILRVFCGFLLVKYSCKLTYAQRFKFVIIRENVLSKSTTRGIKIRGEHNKRNNCYADFLRRRYDGAILRSHKAHR